MFIGSSKSIWGHGGRFDGEEVSLLFSWGGWWGSSIPDLQILDVQRLASLLTLITMEAKGQRGLYQTDHYAVVCLVAWPLNESEAGDDLVLMETSLLFLC